VTAIATNAKEGPAAAAPLVVAHWPHLRRPESVPTIMWSVAAALGPAAAAAGYFFGVRALLHVALAVATAIGSEALVQKLRRRPVTVADGSAAVTGLLVAFCLPAQARWFVPIVASAAAIVLAKHCFGGLGSNIWNPALIGRAFVHISFPVDLNPTKYPVLKAGHFVANVGTALQNGVPEGVQAVTGASPMKVLKLITEGHAGDPAVALARDLPGLWDMFIGKTGGCLGETSALLLVAGAAYLIYRGWVRWQVPVGYLGTVIAGAVLFGYLGRAVPADLVPRYVLYHLLGGGLMLGALFMATDMVTTPLTDRGLWVFGVGCGALTILIRLFSIGGYPEGVCYSILLMNTAVPLIDRWTARRIFGHKP
jgi:electron transport complex protein RnfD